jgi:hypothetical protein
MEPALRHLIDAYVEKAVELIPRLTRALDLALPISNREWSRLDIPQKGSADGLDYFKHGYGVAITCADCIIDVDFGKDGEYNGFDAWRLFQFVEDNRFPVPYQNYQEVDTDIQHAEAAGEVYKSGNLYFLVTGDSMEQSNNELLINSFLDAATALIPKDKLQKRLNRMVAQFFYLGIIDFLRQAESLSDREFYILIARTYERYGIPLNMPVQQYLDAVARNIENAPTLEEAMIEGANSFRDFWVDKDTNAPSSLAMLIVASDKLSEEYERIAEEQDEH